MLYDNNDGQMLMVVEPESCYITMVEPLRNRGLGQKIFENLSWRYCKGIKLMDLP